MVAVSGYIGTETLIGLQTIVIQNTQSIAMVILHSQLLEQSIVNNHIDDHIIGSVIGIRVAYSSDTEVARQLLFKSILKTFVALVMPCTPMICPCPALPL